MRWTYGEGWVLPCVVINLMSLAKKSSLSAALIAPGEAIDVCDAELVQNFLDKNSFQSWFKHVLVSCSHLPKLFAAA